MPSPDFQGLRVRVWGVGFKAGEGLRALSIPNILDPESALNRKTLKPTKRPEPTFMKMGGELVVFNAHAVRCAVRMRFRVWCFGLWVSGLGLTHELLADVSVDVRLSRLGK